MACVEVQTFGLAPFSKFEMRRACSTGLRQPKVQTLDITRRYSSNAFIRIQNCYLPTVMRCRGRDEERFLDCAGRPSAGAEGARAASEQKSGRWKKEGSSERRRARRRAGPCA